MKKYSQDSEQSFVAHAIHNFAGRLSDAVEKAHKFGLHGFAGEALETLPMNDDEKDALAVFVALSSLDAPSRQLVIDLSRMDGESNRFGDQALVALSNFNRKWTGLKTKIEASGIEIPRG